MKKKLIGSIVIVIVVAVIFGVLLLQKFTPETSETITENEIYGKYLKSTATYLYLKSDGNYTIQIVFLRVSTLSEGTYEIKGNEITFHQTKKIINIETNRPFYPDEFKWTIKWTEPIELIDHEGIIWKKKE